MTTLQTRAWVLFAAVAFLAGCTPENPAGGGSAGGGNGGSGGVGPGAGGTSSGSGGMPSAQPGQPLVFYTDLTSAPPGAYVTLWGRGFGATRGSSTVTLNGASVASYVSWSEGMIELKLAQSATSGPLVVHTTSGDSPPTALSVHAGRLLFAAANGNDSWSGTLEAPSGSDGPFQSLGRGRDALRAGDVLYLRARAFTQADAYNSVLSLRDIPTGTAATPVAVVGYPGEVVTLGDNTLEKSVSLYRGDNGPVLDYLTVAKLHLRPSCFAFRLENGSHGRLVGNEITGATDACMSGTIEAVDWGTDPEHIHDWKLLGNYIHANGNTKLEHGIYLGGYGTNAGFEIAWNRISEQTGGRAIQLYGHQASDYIQHISIHDNEISEIDRDGIVLGNTDADILYLSDIHIFNNIFWRAGRCTGWGVRVGNPTATGILVEYNTFYDNGAGNRACDQSSGSVESQVLVEGATSVVLENNLFAPAGSEADTEITTAAGVVTGSHNLYGGTPPAWDSSPTRGAPGFLGASTGNFHLASTSAAIGIALPSTVTVDHDGVSRPQGNAPDVGAYEAVP
jgi:hypothetical protein